MATVSRLEDKTKTLVSSDFFVDLFFPRLELQVIHISY